MTGQPLPEWSHPIDADTIDHEVRIVIVRATESERNALARRFDLPHVDSLAAEVSLKRQADGIIAQGTLDAALAQRCVVTGEDLPQSLSIPFNLRFRQESQEERIEADEIELDEADCDTILYEGGHFDLGEALADTLYLALDPFPRGPNADAFLKEAGVKSEEEAGPFGALADIFKKR